MSPREFSLPLALTLHHTTVCVCVCVLLLALWDGLYQRGGALPAQDLSDSSPHLSGLPEPHS